MIQMLSAAHTVVIVLVVAVALIGVFLTIGGIFAKAKEVVENSGNAKSNKVIIIIIIAIIAAVVAGMVFNSNNSPNYDSDDYYDNRMHTDGISK